MDQSIRKRKVPLSNLDRAAYLERDTNSNTPRVIDVAGYEGKYAVSEDGRVWAYPNASRSVGRWLKTMTNNCGYPYVVFLKDKQRKPLYVHRLVAKAFLAESDKPQVNHKNGVKHDNRAENLEWMTSSENKLHAFRTGITKISESQRQASSRNITNFNLSKATQ